MAIAMAWRSLLSFQPAPGGLPQVVSGRYRHLKAIKHPYPKERKMFLRLSSNSRECPTYFREARSKKKPRCMHLENWCWQETQLPKVWIFSTNSSNPQRACKKNKHIPLAFTRSTTNAVRWKIQTKGVRKRSVIVKHERERSKAPMVSDNFFTGVC